MNEPGDQPKQGRRKVMPGSVIEATSIRRNESIVLHLSYAPVLKCSIRHPPWIGTNLGLESGHVVLFVIRQSEERQKMQDETCVKPK